MRPPLDGTILLTGASSGIGLELARQLAPRARALALVARRTEKLEALAAELRAAHPQLTVSVHPCDLARRAAIDDLLPAVDREVGPPDVLVNNAGLGDVGMFDHTEWAKVQQMIDVNITSLTYLTHRVLAGMIGRRRGGILNVSSGFGLAYAPAVAAYAATKHFVSALSEALRVELLPYGVVVSQLCPGPVHTGFDEAAGNFVPVPGLASISAVRCARAAVRGFARGRAIIVPGFLIKLLLALGAITPRFILRRFYGPVARRIRALQEEKVALGATPGAR